MENKIEKLKATKSDNMLTLEEMEDVSGGSYHQLSCDGFFLRWLLVGRPGQPQNAPEFWELNEKDAENIVQAWKTVGVECKGEPYLDNKYYIKGREVSMEDAYNHAMNLVGKWGVFADWYFFDRNDD